MIRSEFHANTDSSPARMKLGSKCPLLSQHLVSLLDAETIDEDFSSLVDRKTLCGRD